jgi:oxygen-independent coproporphyrinogen-3 oxidase
MPMTGDPNNREISLYFHIPFCTRKCHYCHFYVLPNKEALREQFLVAIEQEWQMMRPLLQAKRLKTLYFGGGTPYLLGPKAMDMLIGWVARDMHFQSDSTEITLEANPEDIDTDTLRAYRASGINRLSIGIQTLDPALLQRLGRIHTAEKGIQAIHTANDAGIANISVDLMYDLPGQTLSSWETTLKVIVCQPIAHLSLYNLTIEPYTHFHKNRQTLLPLLPDEDISAAMYEMAQSYMAASGLEQYEISAFARNGCISLHNSGYWLGRDFLGFGPSAFSYWKGKRFRNIANLSKYCSMLSGGLSPVDYEEVLEPAAALSELLVLNLRLIAGVDIQQFQDQHGQLPKDSWQAIAKLCDQNLLCREGNHIKMTPKGVLFYDSIAVELI